MIMSPPMITLNKLLRFSHFEKVISLYHTQNPSIAVHSAIDRSCITVRAAWSIDCADPSIAPNIHWIDILPVVVTRSNALHVVPIYISNIRNVHLLEVYGLPSNGVTLMGGGDFDNLIKLIISIPNSCSHSSDCRLFILPCLSDWDTTSNVMNVHYLVSRTHNCIDMLGLLISRFNGTIHNL